MRERSMRSPRLPWGALLIVVLMLGTAPSVAAMSTAWSGPAVVVPTHQEGDDFAGFTVHRNQTITNASLDISTAVIGADNGTVWHFDDLATGLATGTFAGSELSATSGQLELAHDPRWTRIDDLEVGALQLPNGWRRGGTPATTWRTIDPTWTDDGGGANHSANGTLPGTTPTGDNVVGTSTGAALEPDTDAWLRSQAWIVPETPHNYTLSFDHQLHLHTDASGSGEDGAWVEASTDSGATWQWVEPVGGYPGNVSAAAPLPIGAPGTNGSNGMGFPVYTGNLSGWRRASFILDDLPDLINTTGLLLRFRVWTSATPAVQRTGWFIDNVSLDNENSTERAWFHGNLTGDYLPYAHAGLITLLNLSTTTTGAELALRMDWDIEGGSFDNFHVEVSPDNESASLSNWTALTVAGGLPQQGVRIGTITYGDETNGWVPLAWRLPANVIGDDSVWVRVRMRTDTSLNHGGGYNPPEGLFVDDLRVWTQVNGTWVLVAEDRFENNLTAWHQGYEQKNDEWGHVSRQVGASHAEQQFEGLQFLPAGWAQVGTGWEWGTLAAAVSGPVAFPSGSRGYGTGLVADYGSAWYTQMYSPEYDWPAGSTGRLQFIHWICAEDGYDGGTIDISTDAGATWNTFGVPPSGISWYDTVIGAQGSPLHGLPVFDGPGIASQQGNQCARPLNSWKAMSQEIGALNASTVRFRFVFGADSSVSFDGWYLDQVGVEIDRWRSAGDWTSTAVSVPEGGLGWLAAQASVPEGASVRASVLLANGSAIPWLTNRSLPLSLEGLAPGTAVRVRLHLATSDPAVTPSIRAVSLGTRHWLDGPDAGELGWVMPPDVVWEPGEGRWEGLAATVGEFTLPWLPSERPLSVVHLHGSAFGVSVWLMDMHGGLLGPLWPGDTWQATTPMSGWGVLVRMDPGGWLRGLEIDARTGVKAESPWVDAAGDGMVAWSFPADPAWGGHGWQRRAAAVGGLSTNASLVGASIPLNTTLTVDVLLPSTATVREVWVSWALADGSRPATAPSLAGAVLMAEGNGTAWSLPAGLAGALRVAGTALIQEGGRVWRNLTLELPAMATESQLRGLVIEYELSERIGDQQDAYQSRLSAAANESAANQLSLGPRIGARAGGVRINGVLEHAPRVANHPFAPPVPMHPTTSAWTVTTHHDHLFNGSLLASAALQVDARDNRTAHLLVEWPNGTPAFRQIGGLDLLLLDTQDSNVTFTASGVEVIWSFTVPWIAGPVPRLDWTSAAYEGGGLTTNEAHTTTGGPVRAIEPDVAITSMLAWDELGRRLDARQLPGPAVIASGGHLRLAGELRFVGDAFWPLPDEVVLVLLLDGIAVRTATVHENGSWSAELDVPSADTNVTIGARLSRVGPAGGPGMAQQVGSPAVLDLRLDAAPPTLVAVQVATPNGPLDADGLVWNEGSADVRLIIRDAIEHGPELALHIWREHLDDTNEDGIADAAEYERLIQLLPASSTGDLVVTFVDVNVLGNDEGGRVSLYVTGADAAGWPLEAGGGPGLERDAGTIISGPNHETQLPFAGAGFATVEGWVVPGQTHTVTLELGDPNGLQTLDRIDIMLAGEAAAPYATVSLSPRDGGVLLDADSLLTAEWVSTVELSPGRWVLTVNVTHLWPDEPLEVEWQVPDIVVWDDGQRAADSRNLADLRWQLDVALELQVDAPAPGTEPRGVAVDDAWAVQPGDAIAAEVRFVHAGSGLTARGLPTDTIVSLEGEVAGESLLAEARAPNGTAHLALVLPERSMGVAQHRFSLATRGLPAGALVTSLDVLDVLIDAKAPRISFPPGILTLVESDRLATVPVTIVVRDDVAVVATELTLHWTLYRQGVLITQVRGTAVLPLLHATGTQSTFGGTLDLRPPPNLTLLDGDLFAVSVEVTDAAGHSARGAATWDDPRTVPIVLRTVEPRIISTGVTPAAPSVGETLVIHAMLTNAGTRVANRTIRLLETLDDGRLVEVDNVSLDLVPGVPVDVTFEFVAWREGTPDLTLEVEHDPPILHRVDTPVVAPAGGVLLGGILRTEQPVLLGGVVLLFAAVIVGLLMWSRRRLAEAEVFEDVDDAPWIDDERPAATSTRGTGRPLLDRSGGAGDLAEAEAVLDAASRDGPDGA